MVTYLSALNPTSAVNGYGPYERDMSNGQSAAGDGHPITLAGVVYARGLGTHAAADLRYPMLGGTCNLLASLGIDDESGNAWAASPSRCWPTATSLYTSPRLTGSSATVSINLAIPAGTTQLRLVVGNGGDNINSDHGDWANARLSCT